MGGFLTEEERTRLQQMKLRVHLEACVPLAMLELQMRGGPDEVDRERARQFGAILACHGDALLFPTAAKEAKAGRPCVPGTADMVGQLVRSLAVMAFAPGGVTFQADEELHFVCDPPEDERALDQR